MGSQSVAGPGGHPQFSVADRLVFAVTFHFLATAPALRVAADWLYTLRPRHRGKPARVADVQTDQGSAAGPGDRKLAAARGLVALLAPALQAGFSLRLWNGELHPLGPEARPDLAIAVRSPAVLTRLLRRPRLTTVIDQFAAGGLAIEGGTLLDIVAARGSGSRGLARRLDKRRLMGAVLPFLFGSAGEKAQSLAFTGNPATSAGARRDDKTLVQFHYDLSNAFYALFLDPEMQYSCAYFPNWDAGLAEAQQAKLDMICRKLRLAPGERFLDIGCGWGGLVCHAARHYGAIAHGVTLSQAQYDFAQDKIARLGLQGRVTVELKDYRALAGEYDKIASVGMFEHVGVDDRDEYFTRMRDLLRPRGIMLHHAITRPAKRSARAFRRKRPEYAALVSYIFPGGDLDHIGNTIATLERNGFEAHDVEAWREHYQRTTRLWCERLYARRAEAESEIGAARTNLWLLYLAGCSLGFERGGACIFQTVATKRARGPSFLPPTRADLYEDRGAAR
jgi:cyclopropane-fatty-acyl-phospholipid synthase